VLLAALVVVEGCAIENSGLPGSQAAVVRAYGRNPVVQAPTAVGNVLGLFVALPV
jgi:carbonic anhydrase/acetyltransferase-like protein (isoleucine patch superfamily)